MIAPAEAIPIAEARKLIPGRPSKSTVWRWVLYGIKGVKLRSFLVGGQRYTDQTAIDDFIRELTEAGGRQQATTTDTTADGNSKAAKPTTPPPLKNTRRRPPRTLAAQRAEAELKKQGV